MAEQFAAQRSAALERLSQPVLFVQKETVVYRNHAAAALIGSEPLRLDALLSEDELAGYRQFDGQGALELPVRLGPACYSVTVSREPDCDVFIASANPLSGGEEPGVLSTVSRTVRQTLNELFDAASALFPNLEEQEDPEIQKETARINKGLYRLLRLTNNLSDIGALGAGQTRPLLERTELGLFLNTLRDHTAALCEKLDVELLFRRPTQPVFASVDGQKLERAILNLISNSLRSIGRGGTIELRLSDAGSAAMIQVIDNGRGMTAEELAHVFERYDRPDRLPTDPGRGMGLGLPLVRAAAMLHGGTAMVLSDPDRGTTVTLTISRRLGAASSEELRSPVSRFDYAGDHDHVLLELADVLPTDAFDSSDVN